MKRYTQVYTGNGKGKSTAAFGLAARALGRNLKPAIIQFMKYGKNYGEYVFFSPLMTVIQFGREGFVDIDNPSDIDIKLAEEGIAKSRDLLFSGLYDIVILDEILAALSFGLISENIILDLIKNKPDEVELVLTGRNATKNIIEAADLVTEMKEIKHYYKKGIMAREGIEF